MFPNYLFVVCFQTLCSETIWTWLVRPLQKIKTQIYKIIPKGKSFFYKKQQQNREQGDDIMIVACHAWLSWYNGFAPSIILLHIHNVPTCMWDPWLLRSTRSNHLLNHFSHGEYSLFQIGMYVIQGIVQHNSKKSDHSPLFHYQSSVLSCIYISSNSNKYQWECPIKYQKHTDKISWIIT